MRVFHHPGAHGGEETRQPQIGDHNHHAKQQNDGVEVDRPIGLLEGEHGEGDHERGADDGGAGAVHAKSRQATDGQHQVGAGEYQNGGKHEILS